MPQFKSKRTFCLPAPGQPLALAPFAVRPVPRRGLSRAEAAVYVGIGTTKFDEMVAEGRMPKPIRIDGRVIWDIRDLDTAFDNLSNPVAANPWHRVA
jgi:predicted DNA-binding transcriptional regulator AlpA